MRDYPVATVAHPRESKQMFVSTHLVTSVAAVTNTIVYCGRMQNLTFEAPVVAEKPAVAARCRRSKQAE